MKYRKHNLKSRAKKKTKQQQQKKNVRVRNLADKIVHIKFEMDRISDTRTNCTFLGVKDETKITVFIYKNIYENIQSIKTDLKYLYIILTKY